MDDSDRDIRCYGQALLSFIAGERIQEVSVLRRSSRPRASIHRPGLARWRVSKALERQFAAVAPKDAARAA